MVLHCIINTSVCFYKELTKKLNLSLKVITVYTRSNKKCTFYVQTKILHLDTAILQSQVMLT